MSKNGVTRVNAHIFRSKWHFYNFGPTIRLFKISNSFFPHRNRTPCMYICKELESSVHTIYLGIHILTKKIARNNEIKIDRQMHAKIALCNVHH